MSALTQVLLWCPVQVSVLAFAALCVGSLFGRRRPAAGATVAVAAMAIHPFKPTLNLTR